MHGVIIFEVSWMEQKDIGNPSDSRLVNVQDEAGRIYAHVYD